LSYLAFYKRKREYYIFLKYFP